MGTWWWTTLDGRTMDNQMKAQTSGIIKVLAWCWAPKSEYRLSWRLAQHLQAQPWATHLSIIHISAVSITSENCFSWSMMIILLYTHPTFSCISCTSALPSPCRSRGATVILPATNGLDSTRSTMETCASGAECFSRKSSWWGRSGRRGLALYYGTSETQRI